MADSSGAAGSTVPIPSATSTGMNFEQGKALGIATLGGALEFYEFIIFIYLAPMIGHHFFPADMPAWLSQVQTLGIFAAGYLIRPVGGIVLASIGDRIGRKKMFAFTLALLAVPTVIIGLLPGYAQIGIAAPLLLLLCRVVQGLSIGGELPGALVFVAESVPQRRLGLSCGILAGSLAVGSLVGAASVAGLTSVLGKEDMMDYGWRIPFIFGGILGLLSAQLRRYAHETPVFQQMRARNELARQVPIKTLLSDHRTEILLCLLVACMTAVVTGGVHQFPVVYLIGTLNMDPAVVYQAQFYAQLALITGDISMGWLSDRIGARRAFVLSTFALVASLFWFYSGLTPDVLALRYVVVGFLSGSVCITFVLLITSFPAQLRYTGIAVSYNMAAAIIGGSTPLLMALLSRQNPIWPAAYPAIFCAIAVLAALALYKYRKPINPYAAD